MPTFEKRESGRWQVKVRRTGHPSQSKTFETKAAAMAWARSIERAMDTKSFIPPDDASKMTFAAASKRYHDEVLPRLRGKVQAAYVLSRVTEHFGRHALAGITPAMLSEYRDERLRVVSPQTVHHELGIISRIFKTASVDWGITLTNGNPVSLIRKPALANDRDRRLLGKEEEMLMEALQDRESPLPHAAATLAIETAGRMSELLSLKWSDVDLERRTARLHGIGGGVTKNGDAWRDIPLSSNAVRLLQGLDRNSNFVLPISQNALQIAWGRSMKAARKKHLLARLCQELSQQGFSEDIQAREVRALVFKKRKPLPESVEAFTRLEGEDTTLVDLHFHDLRHEATSRLADKLQMHELMKVTGHKTSRMVSRYYHPRAEDLAKKLD